MTISLITSFDYSLLFWALFLGLLGCAWSLNVARKRKKERGAITPIVTEQLRQKTRNVLANTAKIGMGTVLGILLGIGIREHQLLSNQQTYTDVTIVAKLTDRDFDIWPDRMKQQRIQLCPSSTVDWREGEVLDDWTFEQRNGCKRVISYHKKPKGEINASIQVR